MEEVAQQLFYGSLIFLNFIFILLFNTKYIYIYMKRQPIHAKRKLAALIALYKATKLTNIKTTYTNNIGSISKSVKFSSCKMENYVYINISS